MTPASRQPTDARRIREEVDERIAAGAEEQALALLDQLWSQEAGSAAAGFLRSRFRKIREKVSCTPCRVAILRSATLEPVVPLLQAGGAAGRLDLEVRLGGFNAYAQEILDPTSWLQEMAADVAILAVHTRDLAPDLWQGFSDLSPSQAEAAVDRAARDLEGWVRALRDRTQAHILLHNLEQPPHASQGLLDRRGRSSQGQAIRAVNRRLEALTEELPGLHLLDYDGLIARQGRLRWYDPGKWAAIRQPLSAGMLAALAEEWLRYLHPLCGRISKALVCDLDGTLWGGIVGEDGLDGIALGGEPAGAAYLEFQRAILDLHARGVILAICSKNNPADAMEALEGHPEMLLRPGHFAALRIGWTDKATYLREIAEELNIGVDSLAFVDDNPAECRLVRSRLPEVKVIHLPEDPGGFTELLRRQPVFERLALTEDDRRRGRMYAEQRKRRELQAEVEDLEGFYRSLEMEAEVQEVSDGSLPRIAQLTQRTNQFNLTTRRYGEREIRAMAEDPGGSVLAIRVLDRFGDSGIVGVAIGRQEGDGWELDSFLLSCRVIGRTVETALLAAVCREALQRGCRRVTASFLPTRKNAPAASFLEDHGFHRTEETQEGSRWELDLTASLPEPPPWIACRFPDGDAPHG